MENWFESHFTEILENIERLSKRCEESQVKFFKKRTSAKPKVEQERSGIHNSFDSKIEQC